MSKAFRDLIIVGGTTASRLIGTLVLYGVFAREFGAAIFGKFAFWYSIGIFIGAISDYGFGQQILVQLSNHNRANQTPVANNLCAAKLFMVAMGFIPTLSIAHLTTDTYYEATWISSIIIASVAATMIEFFGVMLRAQQLYAKESLRSFHASFTASLISAGIAIIYHDLLYACCALLAIRLIALIFQYNECKLIVGVRLSTSLHSNLREVLGTMKRGISFASDSIFGQVLANTDIFIAKHYFSEVDSGIYMAANRLLIAGISGIPVLSNTFIPKMVIDTRTLPRLLIFSALGIAIIASAIFTLTPHLFATFIFGPEFSRLGDILPLIGAIISLRYLTSIDGMILSAKCRQNHRAIVTLFLITALIFTSYLITRFITLTPQLLLYVIAILWIIAAITYRAITANVK